jgi:monovalent cation:H+ antiporter, CPA1 family
VNAGSIGKKHRNFFQEETDLSQLIVPSIEILVTAFLAIMVVASLIAFRAKVPYTLVLVFIGVGLAFITAGPILAFLGQGPIQNSLTSIVNQMRSLYETLIQGPQGGLFVGLVVPPLLFEGMIHIRSADIRSSIKPGFLLATIGVVISIVVAGFILWKVVGLALGVSFLFASVISPTDAATVLEIFKRAKVPSRLAALVDMEAALNDATGVVAFSLVLGAITLNKLSILPTVTNFILFFGGGVAVGLVVGLVMDVLSALVSDRLTETVLTISAVYGSYALASALGVSGLVAVAIVGLYFGNITLRASMGPSTRETVTQFWEFAAFLANSVAFLFIGFRTDVFKMADAIILILVAYLAVTAARAASVYPILTFLDRVDEKIPWKWRNVTMLGGMRGALSIALAASIPIAVIGAAQSDQINTLVLGVAFISISLQAAFLFRYIHTRFREEKASAVESLDIKLSKVVSSIEALHKMKDEHKISEDEYLRQLQDGRENLRDVLREIESTVDPKNVLRARASEIYSSVLTLPVSRARKAFKLTRPFVPSPPPKPVQPNPSAEEEVNEEKKENTSDDQAT